MERGNPARGPRSVVLLSDFGLIDPYVGQMRGTIARLAPEVRILDLTHGVTPFNLPQAGYFLAASAPHFPEDAVFVAVVDPGVGTDRRIVAVERRRQIFLAPDNGLLDLVLQGGESFRVFDLTPDAITLGRASATFQGRDVLAPLAARLALGEPPSDLGTAMDPAGLVRSPWGRPVSEDGGVAAQVLHVDRFGNCVLNLRQDFVLPAGEVRLTAPHPAPAPGADLCRPGRGPDRAAPGQPRLSGAGPVHGLRGGPPGAHARCARAPGLGGGVIFLNRFLLALSFLTRLGPTRRAEAGDLAGCLVFLPVVGLVLGLAVCLPFGLGLFAGKPWVQAWLAAALSLALPRGLHLDGLADVADGVTAHAEPERFWRVVKDSHCGAFGVMALVLPPLALYPLYRLARLVDGVNGDFLGAAVVLGELAAGLGLVLAL